MRAAIIALLLLWTGSAWAEEPAQIIEHLYARLLEVMKAGPEMGFQGRFDALAPVVDETFDLRGMTRLAVGARLPPEDFDRVVEAFRRYTIANYASQFRAWDGERFETNAAVPAHSGGQLVPSRIIPATGEPARIAYLMRQQGDGWRVTDVLLDGTISQLALRRSEFQAVLKQRGATGLVQVLDSRTPAHR
ncbi:MAG: ABC transporter substrate-binding protein [Rhodospirillaceae bacterium]|nr:ABC transporter substrate-binding protein [Rhodospirillales bacterium]